jgi:hypothetical protein
MKNNRLSLITARNFLKYFKERSAYAFFGKISPWTDTLDVAVTGMQESPRRLIEDFNDSIIAKKISNTDSSIVVRKVLWVANKIFSQYSDQDLLLKTKDFYCLTSTRNVYKCISNNFGAQSTVEPSSVSSNIFQTADGYKWKFLYTITANDALKFQTTEFMPVKELLISESGYENQFASQVAAVSGTIDRIDVLSNGFKYTQGTTITIIGDGSGATASVVIHPVTGVITGVSMVSYGSGYTRAEIVISDPAVVKGSGFVGRAVISPFFGHGSNPAEELYASNVMAVVSLVGDEGGTIKNDFTFRKVIVVLDPKLADNSYASTARYSDVEVVTVSGVSGSFRIGEKVTWNNGSGYVVYTEATKLHLSSMNKSSVITGVITGTSSAAMATFVSSVSKPLKPSTELIFKSYFDPRLKSTTDTHSVKAIFSF